MAIALDTSTAWADDSNYDGTVTTAAFSPAAGTILLAFVASYDNRDTPSISNSGTSLTWTAIDSVATGGVAGVRAYWAYNASAQSNITVSWNDAAGATAYPALKVYSLSGADTSDPIGALASGTGATGTSISCPPGSSTLSEVANSWQFTVVHDNNGLNGALSSSDLTYSATSSLDFGISGYRSIGAAGTALASTVTRAGAAGTSDWITFELRALNVTTHNADAALSTTSTVTASANSSRVASAAVSAAAAVSPTAVLARPLDVGVSTSAALTATATRTAMVDAALSTSAALTATMDVTPPAGTVTADAALSTTATLTSTAILDRPLAVALSTSADLAATAVLLRALGSAVSTTSAISASLIVEGEVPTTVGFMRGVEFAGATLRNPATNPTDSPTIAALVSIDSATLSAVVSTSVTPSRYGVAVFVGGSVDPITAGLLPAGSAYVWFAADGIHVQEAS